MTTQERIDHIVDLMRRVVDKKGSKDVADGHCTFGIEYPAFNRQKDGIVYFASIDLHGRYFFTDETMEGALERAEKHIKQVHRII